MIIRLINILQNIYYNPVYHLAFAEFRFYPELIIYGVYLLEVALKKVLPHTIHTTVIFLAFRRHTITCVQLANVPL